MNTILMPILALSSGEIISILIAIGVILSGIFGQAQETKKTQKKRQAAKRGDGEAGDSVTQLDAIAQRRREQLEALARKRRGGGSESASRSGAPLSDRQAARVASDERAALARAQETSDGVRWSDPGDRVTETTALDARVGARKAQRQQRDQQRELGQEIRRRQMQEKAERQAQQQRNQQTQRQRQAQQQRQQSQRRAPQIQLPKAETVSRRVMQSDEDRLAESAIQHELDQIYAVAPVDRSEGDAGVRDGRSKLVSIMAGRSWREAIILKEVLDRPIAMRDHEPSGI